MVGRLLVGFVWLNIQLSVSWQVYFQWGSCGSIFWLFVSWLVDFQWGSCGSIFSFLCHGRQTFSGVRVAQSLVFCVMVGRLLVGFVWLNLQLSVSWLVNFQWGSWGSIFCFLCHGWQTFSGLRVAQSFDFCVMLGRLLVGFVWLNLLFFVSWLVDFQWGSCGSIFSFLCHGRQTFSGVRVAQSLVFCVMVGRPLVGFVWLNLQFSVSWQVDFQWGSCGSIFSFLCHGRQTFSGVRVAQSLVFCVMVGKFLLGFVWLNLQFSVSWQLDFQWASCVSIFSFLCYSLKIFSGVHVAQSFVFCVMVGRFLVGFVWLNLQFSVSWLVDFQWGSCGSIFSFLCHGRQWGSSGSIFSFFSGVRVAQSVFSQTFFRVSWLQVDFQWGSCGSIFSFLCHGWQTFSGVRVAQSLVFCVMVRQTFSGVRVAQSLAFCVMVGKFLVGFVWLNLQFSVSWQVDFQWASCGSIFSFLCYSWQTFSGVRVAQSFVFCVMVGRLLGGFVWLNLQFSVSWLVNFQWGSCGSIFSFLCHGRQTWASCGSIFSCVMLVDFQWGSCGPIFCFLCHGWQILVGFVWLNLQFSVSWQVDFQWASCGSIFSFLCHSWQTFSGVPVAQSFVFCVMVGRLLVGFVLLNLQFSVSWLVDFQWASCGSIFRFLCHGWQTVSGVRVAQSFVFCVMVGRLLVGFVWLNLQFSVSWQVDFQWGSCGSIFSFLCYGWQTFSGVPVAQSFVFCVMVGRLLVGFVCLNLQFSVSWLVDFQWGSCGSIFSFLFHGCQTFSGVRVAQSLVFCVIVGRLLVGFVWLNLQLSVSWQVYFQWGSCGSIFWFFVSWLVDFQWGSCGSIFSFLCHGRQTFSGVRVAQSLVFCVMVGRLLVGFVWLNLQPSVSWLVNFQWGSWGAIFCFLCHGLQTFSGLRVAQSLDFCVMVGRHLVGFVCLNLLFFVSWLVDFQWGSCGSIFSFLCHGRQTFSGVRVAQSLVFCVMVGRPLVGFVWLNLQFSVSWQVDFQWGSCGSIFSFLCHGRQTFSGVRVAQSLAFCVMLVNFQWGSCGSIFSFLCHGRQTFSGLRVSQSLVFCVIVCRLLVGFLWPNLLFSVSCLVGFSGVRVAQSLVFCVMVSRILVGFVWLNLQLSVSWQVNFQWGSCGSIFSFLCHGRQTFSGVRVAQSLVFCVIVGRLLVGFLWPNLLFSVSWLVDFQWGSCGSIFSFMCHGW